MADSQGTPRRRSGRAVFGVNAVVSVMLVLLVAAIALVVQPPAPPGIAAFAPQAAKPITKAPPRQSSVNGSGAGACAAGQSCAVRTPTPRPSVEVQASAPRSTPSKAAQGVPSALQCYTWPDGSVTQTSDPQSPSCVASWDATAGNGGTTSPGVTATTVTLTVPGLGQGSARNERHVYEVLAAYFNSRYELYGRKIVIAPSPLNGDWTATGQHAAALSVRSTKAFASVELPATSFDGHPGAEDDGVFRTDLAKASIVSVESEPSLSSTARQLQALAPYAWNYRPTHDVIEANFAQVACRSLIHRPAKWAGTGLATRTRTFAALYSLPESEVAPPIKPLTDPLEACGASVKVEQGSTDGGVAQTASVRTLQADGITTVVCLAVAHDCDAYMTTASQLGYEPEWVILGVNQHGNEGQWSVVAPANQAAHLYGMAPWDKYLSPGDTPAYQALQAVGDSGQTYYGEDLRDAYSDLMLFAAGLQLAGPHLTPKTFTHGLEQAAFPNPGAEAAPSYQGEVAVAAGSYTLISDLAMLWWNPSGTGYTNGNKAGGFCYLQRGRRFHFGDWPSGSLGLFDRAACR